MKRTLKLLALFASVFSLFSCNKVEKAPYVPIDDDDPSGDSKVFYVYESMAYEGNDHNHQTDKISPVSLIYEAALTDDAKELDIAKINSQISLVNLTGVKAVSTDIEAWYSSLSSDEMKSRFTTLFNMFKSEVSGCKVGNYGVPVSNLNVLRFTPSMAEKSEDEIIARWKSNSEKRLAVGEISDVLYPSLYAMNDNTAQYDADVKTTAEYIRSIFPNKKIIGYVWPQYYDLKTNPFYKQFIPAATFRTMLESCYKYLDGIVLWAGGTDADGNKVPWTDGRVQSMYNVVKEFIAEHYENIKVDSADADADEGQEPVEFHIWDAMNFKSKPEVLLSHGMEPINYCTTNVLSEKEKLGNIYPPVPEKITKLAKAVTKRTLIGSLDPWIADRNSRNADMVARFDLFKNLFKASNPTTPYGFVGIGPTTLTTLKAWNKYDSEFARKDSWLRYAVEPTRVLRQYVDALYIDVTMIDDDIDAWKSDCAQVIKEARRGNNGKKIYACIGEVYYGNPNREDHFVDIFKPVRYETFLAGLEYLYLRTDGIVIFGNCPADNLVEYSEELSVIKAIGQFYNNHKALIDKTLPSTVDGKSEIPDFDEPEPGPVEYRDTIANGGFERALDPVSQLPVIHGNSLNRIPRVNGYFDTSAQTTFPTFASGTPVPDGVWFQRCWNNKWYWFVYQDDTDSAYSNGGKPQAHTGTHSMALYEIDGAAKTNWQDHEGNMEHLFSLAQRVGLDDTKKYELTFWLYRPEKAWSNSALNNAKELRVGIVSSTDAVKETDYTWETTIALDKTAEWTQHTVTFDLPDIISNNPGKSFKKAAIFFSMKAETDASTDKSVRSIVNIDDVVLAKVR